MAFIKKYHWIFIVILVFALDRITKYLVVNYLVFAEPVEVLPILNLFFTYNTGAAFNILSQASGWQEWLFIIIAVGVSIFLVFWQLKIPIEELWLKVAIALVLGGTLGNLYDRIVYHKVIDFLDFYFREWHYPVFNIADSVICIGAVMLISDIMRKK